MIYATFWGRFAAYWIDFIVLIPIIVLNIYMNNISRLFIVYWFLPSLAICIWFHVYLVGKYGGTPGKLIMKMKISMLDGSHVTYIAAFIRCSVLFALTILMSIAGIISTLQISDEIYYSLGFMERSMKLSESAPKWMWYVNIFMQIWIWGEFITMLFNKKRRAIHDFIAGTVVIKSNLTQP